MRAIDADAVMERMKQAYEDMGVDTHGVWNKQLAEIFKAEETDVEDIRQCLSQILGAVAQAPSADRPQGEWIKHDEERDYCSRCKHIFKTRTITKQDKWTNYIDDLGYNYCPNCGARMKGADDE